MHRFFVPLESISAERVAFPAETARQMARVLRLPPGRRVIALDGLGNEFEVELEQVDSTAATGRIVERRTAQNEPRASLRLFLCLTQREKFEWMLQKCTEAGASGFVPVISDRSLVRSVDEGKLERWRKILREAAEQSGRGRIPGLFAPVPLRDVRPESGETGLLLWEGEQVRTLREALAPAPHPLRAAALIGPEGGFGEDEARAAQSAGFAPVSLGRRILRMETAALAAVLLVLHETGDL